MPPPHSRRRPPDPQGTLLRLIYAGKPGIRDLGLGRGLAAKAPSSSDQGYRMFFVRVLPVAPNKFRPPSKVGIGGPGLTNVGLDLQSNTDRYLASEFVMSLLPLLPLDSWARRCLSTRRT